MEKFRLLLYGEVPVTIVWRSSGYYCMEKFRLLLYGEVPLLLYGEVSVMLNVLIAVFVDVKRTKQNKLVRKTVVETARLLYLLEAIRLGSWITT